MQKGGGNLVVKNTIKQFAEEIGVKNIDRLLEQLNEAGIRVATVDDSISADQKHQYLLHLQQQHHHARAESAAPDKIILRRAKTSEIKVSGTHGASSKTVSIQVRKKRTYVKRPTGEEEAAKEEAIAQPEVLGTVAEAVAPVAIVETPVETKPVVEAAPAAPVAEPAYTEEAPAPQATTETADEKSKAGVVKRKDKHHRSAAEEEIENEKHKKKKKSREAQDDRNFTSLLARGADLSRVLKQDDDDSDAAFRRAGSARSRAHGKVKVQAFTKPTAPSVYEVGIPETIKLGDLAQRMSVKAAEVIKVMMRMGIMATINQVLDQDTAILIVEEMGHKAKAVSSDAIEEE